MSLAECVERVKADRSLPVPPPKIVFTGGSKDFLESGANLMRGLVEATNLPHNADVLDIGSGFGRVAVPLTQWLTDGSYRGVEIVGSAVEWCQENITSRFPNFQFTHLDFENETYNRGGTLKTTDVRLPFGDNSFDVVFLYSVFTHLEKRDALAYLHEIARVLRPGGQLYGTWFLASDTLPSRIPGKADLGLVEDEAEGVYYTGEERSLNVVAFRTSTLRAMLDASGLETVRLGSARKLFAGDRQEPVLCVKPAT